MGAVLYRVEGRRRRSRSILQEVIISAFMPLFGLDTWAQNKANTIPPPHSLCALPRNGASQMRVCVTGLRSRGACAQCRQHHQHTACMYHKVNRSASMLKTRG